MNRLNHLTARRWDDKGYSSGAKKDELVQRLGHIEERAERLIEQACELCHYPYVIKEQEQLDEKCRICPLTYLEKLIAGEYPPDM